MTKKHVYLHRGCGLPLRQCFGYYSCAEHGQVADTLGSGVPFSFSAYCHCKNNGAFAPNKADLEAEAKRKAGYKTETKTIWVKAKPNKKKVVVRG